MESRRYNGSMAPARWFPFAFLLIACAPAPPAPAVADTAPQTATGMNIHYGKDPQQTLDLYPVKAKGPLIVFVHGGAWQGGSRHEYDAVAARLQQEGVAVATVDYRLSPEVRHPAHAEDVAHALAWLAAHEKRPLVAVGHSAGAHILATLATDPKLLALAKPVGFVGLEGIYDVAKLAQRWPSYPDWFLKKAFGPEAGWPAASPTRLKLASKAPWLLVHSKGDELVDQGQRDDFAAHLRESGVAVQTLTPEGKTHDGVVQALASPDDEVARAIVAFARAR